MHKRAKVISRLAATLLAAGLTTAGGVNATTSAEQARQAGAWRVEPGQWLSRIVAALEPVAAHRRALMAELVKLNPQAFVNGDANRMHAGATLRLPQRLAAGNPPQAAPTAAAAPDNKVVGHVTVARGKLVARGTDGRERQLHRRSPIQVGDTLETGARGGAHIRFADGAQVAVRRGSLFRIDDYRWEGQANGKERAVLSLLRGGFRTITGAIGKLNRDNYQVKTPFSTIGIRGTDYGMRSCQGDCEDVNGNKVKDGDYGAIKGGAIFAKPNQGKGRQFVGGESFFIANASSEPTDIPSDAGIVYGPDTSLDDSGEGEGGAPDDTGDFRSDGSPEGVVTQAGLESTPNDQESVFDTGQEETAALSGGGVSNERPAPLGAGGIAAYIVESGGQPFGTFVGAIQGEPGEELDIADGSILVTHVADGFGFQEFDRGTAAIVAKGSNDGGTPNGVHWGIWGQGWQANFEGIAETPFATATLAPFIYAERVTTDSELAQLGPLGSQTYSLTNGVVVNQNGEMGTINSFSFDADFLSMNVSNAQLNVTDGPRNWVLSGGQAPLENGASLFLSGSCNGCANPSAIGIAEFGFVGNADAAKAVSAFDTLNGNGNHALVGVAELAR